MHSANEAQQAAITWDEQVIPTALHQLVKETALCAPQDIREERL